MADLLDPFLNARTLDARMMRLLSETTALLVTHLNCPIPRAAAILRGILNFYGIYVFAPLPETMQDFIYPPLPPLVFGRCLLPRILPPPAARLRRRTRCNSFTDSGSDCDD